MLLNHIFVYHNKSEGGIIQILKDVCLMIQRSVIWR